MPLRSDEAPIEGFLSIDGYMDIRNRDPEQVGDRILERLRMLERR
jgi:hypothetical protein